MTAADDAGAAGENGGEPAPEAAEIHAPPRNWWRRWVFSTDHKVIAKQFLWAGLMFLAVGGSLAMLIRWQWAYPGEPVPVVGSCSMARLGRRDHAAAYYARSSRCTA